MASFSTLTVEQFMHRFFIEESPYWSIHNAHRSRELMTKFRPDQDGLITPEELLDYSWMQFQMFVEQSPGGVGKVVLKKNISDNTANSPTYYVQWGAAAGARGAIGSTSMATPGGVDANTQMMLSLQREMFEGRIQDMKDIMELTHQNSQKDAEIEGLMEPGIQSQLLAGGIEILKGMVNKPAAQLGTMGAGDHTSDHPGHQPAPGPTAGPSRPLSMDQGFNDLAALGQLIPDIHPNDALRAIVLFAQSDPDQARTYLSMLINKVK